jgi:hypothetical protein
MGCKCCDGGKVECPDCNNGRVEVVVGDRGYDADCLNCEGRGWLWCDECDGTGEAGEGEDIESEQVQSALADRTASYAEEVVNGLAAEHDGLGADQEAA